jgi:hypothetical protein
LNSNGNTDGANNDYDQLFDPWNPVFTNAEESSTGDASSLEPPPLEDTQMDNTSSNAPPLDSQQEEGDEEEEEEETQIASSSRTNVDPPFWQQYSAPKILGLVVCFGLLLVLFCVLNLSLLIFTRGQKKKQREKDTLMMFSYMSKLDVENMDIRRSPAGGFHVAYLNALANGDNYAECGSIDEFGEDEMEEFGEDSFLSMAEFHGNDDDDEDEQDTYKGTEDSALSIQRL